VNEKKVYEKIAIVCTNKKKKPEEVAPNFGLFFLETEVRRLKYGF
jgi:hypothetical protein